MTETRFHLEPIHEIAIAAFLLFGGYAAGAVMLVSAALGLLAAWRAR